MSKETKDKKTSPADIGEGKICAILAYLMVGIIWYFADEKMKANNFTKFHVKQGIVLLITSLVGNILLGMTFVLAWLIPLYNFAIIVSIVLGIINANNGQKKALPFIGRFGNKLKF